MASLIRSIFGRLAGNQELLCPERHDAAQVSQQRPRLPDIKYPLPELLDTEYPWAIKNTFIDEQRWQPEKQIRSCPVSAIGDRLQSEILAPAAGTALVPGHVRQVAPEAGDLGASACISPLVKEPDSSSRSCSTSAGSPSTENSDDESDPTCSPSSEDCELPARARSSSDPSEDGVEPAMAKLPEFVYPSSLFVKNTFIHTGSVGRGLSLDGFFEEREIRSCPASGIGAPPDLEGNPEEAAPRGPAAAYEGLLAAAAAAAAGAPAAARPV
eukprot:CAMPEP_0197877166 /NCGR_PEP_ID=MMETSP1439-20131203/5952_1 /TAXON_ID=66791 /ORGANISM="Gonyaulax spinifera, Strain CCMP409" /LENGTH=269 /DNA_ID=CAMNT_0043496495 /DNA_START=92 /DNA_END=897 /DNA_ORIENTATION=+